MKENEKVFITGASSGIGAQIAIEYARRGAILGLAARREEKLIKIKQQCLDAGAKEVITYSLDVADQEKSSRICLEFMNYSEKGIDIIIANAGVAYSDHLSSGDATQINQTLITNILGVTNTILPFIPSMKDTKNGKIVIISSIASFTLPAFFGGYAASKVAVRRLADSWRGYLKKYNIQVTTICPGYIKSEMTDINEFNMPFLMDTDVAATKMVKAIDNGKKTYILHWQWRPVIFISNLLGKRLLSRI
ncbi:MAG: SDR family NAD(P)-dependent oxidoreductase [Gammaproteobacteria bacterium]|nr:SDR family NAD(P)-dependent oxidoreductase [Gammaproteobacteria bacterium]